VHLNDDDYVRDQYRTTEKLETRISVWCAEDPGGSPQDVAILALSDIHPHRVLEVGSGKGSLAVRIAEAIPCDLVALDSSVAMVSASRSLGVETVLATFVTSRSRTVHSMPLSPPGCSITFPLSNRDWRK